MAFPAIDQMYSRADEYRRRANEARQRATATTDLLIKAAFTDVARGWTVLAEQVDWLDRRQDCIRWPDNDEQCRGLRESA
jgi:hypothetical protein